MVFSFMERELPSLIGVAVAVVGNLAISAALNIQKYAHMEASAIETSAATAASLHAPVGLPHHAEHPSAEPIGSQPVASSESNHFTQKPIWWLGVILMLIGETGNFMAYGFAPASVIAPLGTVALVSNAIIAPTCLGETFRRRDAVGVIAAIIGTVVIVANGKSSEALLDTASLLAAVLSLRFAIYMAVCIGLFMFLRVVYDSYHTKTVFIDLSLVALFGGWTVLSTKAISTLLGGNWLRIFTFPIFYPLLVIMIGTGILQIRFLNVALSLFDSTVVIPTQFVLFTISAITGSSILYNDFDEQSAGSIAWFLFGCALTFAAVYVIGSERPSTHDRTVLPTAVTPSPCPNRPNSVLSSVSYGLNHDEHDRLLPPAAVEHTGSDANPWRGSLPSSPLLGHGSPGVGRISYKSPGRSRSRLGDDSAPHYRGPSGGRQYLPTVATRVPLAAYSAGLYNSWSSRNQLATSYDPSNDSTHALSQPEIESLPSTERVDASSSRG
ncbi:hypothetical protein H9P43_005558 [Blastocladiella emersonii ATCC 22665]|nr:hypothetical protein H9P43_005558 [Blastocladiella emersonii ATCC 22665]